jgi:hypothetical protein
MSPSDDGGSDEIIDDAAVHISGAVVGGFVGSVGGPIGVIAGALVGEAATVAMNQFRARAVDRARKRQTYVIDQAAKQAGVEPEILLERLSRTPRNEELVLRTLRVAADATLIEQLAALATALASAATTAEDRTVVWETAFVAALGELTPGHLALLQRFTWTANQNNLGDGSREFDAPVTTLNRYQLALAMPGFEDVIDSLIATLEGHGLVASGFTGGAMLGGGVGGVTKWNLTEFGRTFLERLALVGDVLGDHPSPS